MTQEEAKKWHDDLVAARKVAMQKSMQEALAAKAKPEKPK